MTDPKLFERHPNGMLKKGSGGRVAGSRNKLSHDFVNDALESWKVNGKAAFKIVFHERPHEYLKIMLGIIPREYIMTEGKIGRTGPCKVLIVVVAQRLAHALEPAPRLRAQHSQVDDEGAQPHRDDRLRRDRAGEHAVLPAESVEAL